MAKTSSAYVCQSCGSVQPKWSGRCDGCGGWNTLVEEQRSEGPPKSLGRSKGGRRLQFVPLDGETEPIARLPTGIAEFDRTTGGGLVPGSALLIGGDPGIGKSTLLLQAVAAMAMRVLCAYISGEEALDQLRLRAARLDLAKCPVQLATATSVRDIVASLDRTDAPQVVVIDSIQTLYLDTLESAPGTVAQVRAATQELIRLAKQRGFILLMVGHVTKEGMIAGPRVVEHMVDTVLYFEGERNHQFRILRAVKNRFGATDEIGVFEMTGGGLAEVENPSAVFLADREREAPGCCVFAGIEGSRPVLVEVQALVAPSALATPRRAVVGWDTGRLAMVLAVLETRCGMTLATRDVYLNVAGGLRLSEPAVDLAVAAALVSSETGRPLPPDAVVFGEIGLAGEVRGVTREDARLKEAAKLGFQRAFLPRRYSGRDARPSQALQVNEIGNVTDLLETLGAGTDTVRERRVRHG
ncbi:MAG: DNA repair protein RadA [Rhodospirillales bacterium]|nr:DNA repair protein RadA [Rhodospirillales bacterium]